MNHYQNAKFLLSVASLDQLPPDEGIEVAIIGRSNAGKSSILNKITQQKDLARVSKTPGRTQFINLFTIDKTRRLADLPGYGYARVTDEMKEQWMENIELYLNTRSCLKGLILVMDIRHPLQATDQDLLDASKHFDLPVHVVLNKADKLSNNQIHQTENQIKRALESYGEHVSFQTFSVLKNVGTEQLRKKLDNWYRF
ncbi:MAG TPA: ribosome biogenesis GTP-binding protein YihA/YsxC [Gammaproteobacteria bacterium]|nr:ribosome biogenesis GTP-binding protein YihA/YsxC [Gammaproteobacteria bacterium]